MNLLTAIPNEKLFPIAALLTGFLLLVFLTISVNNGRWDAQDQTLLYWFHRLQSSTLDHFFAVLTWLGSLWFLLPASLLLILTLLFYDHRSEAVLFTSGFTGAIVTTYIMKYALERERPAYFDHLNGLPPDPAFPSAHTTQVFIFVLMLWLAMHQLNIKWEGTITSLLITIAIGVATSRLYLQVHFPSDVIAGILVALIWALFAIIAAKSEVLP